MASMPQPAIGAELPLAPAPEGAAPRRDRAESAWSQPRGAGDAYVEVERRELKALTSLRFFAAFYVVIHHLVNWGVLQEWGAGAARDSRWYLAWATQGHVGVTFFFVLSGFILAWCYHRAFATDSVERRAASRSKFWLARFARVWPLHALTFVLFVPVALLGASRTLGGLAQVTGEGAINLALLHAWVPLGGADGMADSFNSPSWTLSVEAFFYLSFPLIAVLLVQRLRWGIAQLALLAGAAWFALGALGVAVAGTERGEWIMRVFPPARLPDFLIGVAIGLIVVQRHQRAALHARAADDDGRRGTWTAIEAGVLALACLSPLVWALAAKDVLPATLGTSWFHLPAIAAAILVLSLERGAISRRVLSVRPLVWLGEVSYALYLTHFFVALVAWRAGAWDILGTIPATILIAAVSIAIAGVVHERFEKRARSWVVARAGRA